MIINIMKCDWNTSHVYACCAVRMSLKSFKSLYLLPKYAVITGTIFGLLPGTAVEFTYVG